MKLSLLSTALLAVVAGVGASALPEQPELAARAKINPSELNALAKQVAQARSSVQADAKRVHSESASVLSGWTGKSAQNYKHRLAKFDSDAKSLAQELHSMSEYLQKVARSASDAENNA